MMTREQINKKRNEWYGRKKGQAGHPRQLNNLRQRVEYLEELLLVLSQPLPWYVRLWRWLRRRPVKIKRTQAQVKKPLT